METTGGILMSRRNNKQEWTPERFKEELLGEDNQLKPFTEENKAALYALTREQALQLDPRLFQRWRFYHEHKTMSAKGAASSRKRKSELKDWSSKVRQLLSNTDLTATMINQNKLPKWFNGLDYDEGDMPTPAEVIAASLMAKAMQGDVRAIEELRKMGFGDKVTIDAGESFFNKSALKLEIVNPNEEIKKMEAKEFGTHQEESPSLPKSIPKQEQVKEIVMPQANEIPGEENIPLSLQQEFDRQEQERQNPLPQQNPNVNEHGIDRSILNKVTITKNKNR